MSYHETTAAEERAIQRLPGQLEASLRKTKMLLERHDNLGMSLEKEAQKLLHDIYGPLAPGFHAEEEYQKARRG